jgi:homoserine dehydrogenase
MKKHGVAILGFGVVGGGVADLLTKNREEITNYLGCEVEIRKILDLRDFPDSPFAHLVTHDFSDVLADGEVNTVMEMMGGSHPAYEYTVAALKAGKNVITSNKEVVANFGDEFAALAKENGVSYRFEAAVGGGIPVINPLLGCIRQNKINEVRGILNGTTNYILTMMYAYGQSYDEALSKAQKLGYAEANPSADVDGIDACRKITILTALAADRLYDVKTVRTEGIRGIRSADVKAAERIDRSIKLLGRYIRSEDGDIVMVAPFLVPSGSSLASVNGVYNAIEVVAEPLGNVMFYGQGAGAGATASAVVGDLVPIIAYGNANPIVPGFNRVTTPADAIFTEFSSRKYIAYPADCADRVEAVFGEVEFINTDDECAFITKEQTEAKTDLAIAAMGASPLSKIRLL